MKAITNRTRDISEWKTENISVRVQPG